MKYRQLSRGFALPTVVISSLVLFAVLIAVMSTIASLRTALDAQYYESLAADAAESGTVHANSCLIKNSYIPTWNSSNLRPNTNCNGGAACTNAANCFVVKTPNYSSTYVVDPVSNTTRVGAQIAKVTGTTDLLKTTDGSKWKTYTKVTYLRVGAGVSAANVKLGYLAEYGSFFGTLGRDGKVRMAGFNKQAQLGNGTSENTLTPTLYGGGAGPFNTIVEIYTHASAGSATFVKTSDGKIYGSGQNDSGQLGLGTVSGNVTSPMLVNIPNNMEVRNVILANEVTYFLLKDKTSSKQMVYASGQCKFGMLGNNNAENTGANCVPQSTPAPVALPAYNASDSNTQPIAVSSDWRSSYVVMAGGRIYGWGDNHLGQLGSEQTWSDGKAVGEYVKPIKVGVFGDAGQPKAAQVTIDGHTLFILDDAGNVSSVGSNGYGPMGSKTALYRNSYGSGSGESCMHSSAYWASPCDSTDANQKMQYIYKGASSSDGEVGAIYNLNTGKCLTVPGTKNSGKRYILTYTSCTPTSLANNQLFSWKITDTTESVSYLKSVAYPGQCVGAGDFALDNCTTSSTGWCDWNQYNCFKTAAYSATPVPFDNSAFAGDKKIVEIMTDDLAFYVRTSSGEVWSAGNNDAGQFGGGLSTVRLSQSTPIKFNLPVGVKAIDIDGTNYGNPRNNYQNLYVVGDDGKVYGAGSNYFGQLGNGQSGQVVNSTPVAMSVFDGINVRAKSVATGYGTAIIYTGSLVYSVGNNAWGQLDDGTTNNSSVPVATKYLNEISAHIY